MNQATSHGVDRSCLSAGPLPDLSRSWRPVPARTVIVPSASLRPFTWWFTLSATTTS